MHRFAVPILLMPLLSALAQKNITCIIKDDPIRRSFKSLTDFQGNKRSFDPRTAGFNGNYVSFLGDILKLEKNAFITYSAEYIVALDLRSKRIEAVEDGAFLTLFCLHYLDLSDNSVTNITQDMFSGLQNLRHLNLSRNSIKYLPGSAFTHLRNLQTLDLSDNKINSTDSRALANLASLEYLYFNHNYLKTIVYGTFANMTSLKELYLNNNAVAILYLQNFCGNNALEKLVLSVNSMVFLMFPKSCQLKSLTHLDISDNMIMNLSITDLRISFPNKSLQVLVNENPFSCDSLKFYWKKFKEFNIYSDLTAPTNENETSDGNGVVKTVLIVVVCLQFIVFVGFLYGKRHEIIRKFRLVTNSDPAESIPLHAP